MKHKQLIVTLSILLLGSLCVPIHAEEVSGKAGEEVNSSNGGDRLKAFQERFAKSDLNKDGKLTVQEMYDFLDKSIKDGSVSDPKPSKTVNMKKLRGLKSRSYLNAFYIETQGVCDTDGNGVLTKRELLTYVMSQRKVYNEKGEIVPHPEVEQTNTFKTTSSN